MKKIINKVAERMITIDNSQFNETCPISIVDINKWEWAQGVGLYGLYRYYEATDDKEYLDYLIKWFNKRIAEGLPDKNVNTCAPLLTLTYIYEITGNEIYINIIDEWANWVMNELPRTEEGGFSHMVSGHMNEGQLWADTLFMCVLFLARAGILAGRNDYLEETKHQFLVHIKYITDKKTGLWFHGWNFKDRSNFANALWARGNCWFTVCVPDYIDIMEDKLEDGIKEFLIQSLISQISALERYQTADGMWHTLIDDEGSYTETSATAGFCYGILKSVRKGYVDKKYNGCAKSALNAVVANTDESGTVLNVSYGTGISYDLDQYRNIEICPMTYGQALAILCLSESLNHN